MFNQQFYKIIWTLSSCKGKYNALKFIYLCIKNCPNTFLATVFTTIQKFRGQ